ncbi:hypothetical protein NQ317_013228 [Molorchus minor]|uniref:DDE Tnp4 domain-containing protein n=1 Tax=Molorchus minor TaxID=1323400 RepID=A0ABQ9JQY5_9CUCU|nr:hypothetical protein NQ317_013228 [Molorchus minor]
MFNQWVKFPNNFEELNTLRLRFYEEHNFPGVIGCVDCTHIAIFPPKRNDPEYPEHIYVNRKGYHSINTQLICDTNLKIMSVNALYPGSTNDAFIWSNSNVYNFLRTLHGLGHTDYYLLGDSGYPLRTWLLTPLEQEPVINTPEYQYNQTHKSTRCLIERCNGVLKMRFRCLLKHRALHYAPEVASQIINACVALHNLCIEHNVPVPDDDEGEVNFGLLDVGAADYTMNVGVVNPELTAGRRARQRLIQNYFNNRQ